VALALAEAEHACITGEWIDGVRSAIRYERQTFERAGGWEDLRRARSGSPPSFMHAWCHGSVGIALTRARLLELFPGDRDAADWADDLEHAMQRGLGADYLGKDHLCCGELGRAAVLARVGRQRRRDDWVEDALGIHEAGKRRASHRGSWSLMSVDDASRMPVPGLMTGLSGVGIYLLNEGDTAWVDALLI
jgi:lantibiotic modifying enzyme